MSKKLRVLQSDNDKDLEILRKISKSVDREEIKSASFQSFLDDLIYTAQNTETDEGYKVAGLAAIQVGRDIRVFCILNDNDEFEIMINPEIKILKEKEIIATEACLSIPHIQGNVARYKKIRVSYLDREALRRKERFTDWEAREIQHEYDHLEGVLFTDKLVD
ncbi:MAG: peptide deformylase [Candidatus Dojkabacteria bacterium]|jgi:peptide deformylase|nr:peptide deformylase [Candidatus Dojkabacteria bacterium]